MTAPEISIIIGLLISLLLTIRLYAKTFGKNKPDPAQPKGNSIRGAVYSLTAAMSPLKKETAYKHWLSYLAGIILHAGIFLGIVILLLQAFSISLPALISLFRTFLLPASFLAGISMFFKRILSSRLRFLRCWDDYASIILVLCFLLLAFLSEYSSLYRDLFLYLGAVMLLYIPVSKLRHALLFVPVRIYLGLFYGRRGVWPHQRIT